MVEQSNETRVTLRPVVPGDEALLLEVYASTRLDELNLLDWDQNQKNAFITMQSNAQRLHYDACYPHADARMILLDGCPVGRILVDRGERETTLIDIALLTEHRGLGIGTRLIQDLLEEAAVADSAVRLHVLKSNPAFRLYERLGFSEVGDDGVYQEMVWRPKLTE